MATSGYKEIWKPASPKDFFLTFEWKRVSYSIENNTSTIEWTMSLKTGLLMSFTSSEQPYYIKIDDTEYRGNVNIRINMNSTKALVTGQTIVKHNKDGSKIFTCTFSQTFPGGYGEVKETGTFTLDKLPQPSPVTCSVANIGSAPIININRYDDSHTYTLSYGFGNQELGYITGTIAEKTTTTKFDSFVWPQSFYQVIPNSTSGTGTLFCKTYSGDTLIGESTYTFTANANRNASTPTINPTITDTNATTVALTGDSSKLIRYFSTASITINAEAKNYATIVSQKAMCGTNYFTTPTGAIGNIQSNKFSFEAVDSRGYKTTVGRDLAVAGRFVDYYLPTCTIGNDTLNTDGSMTVNCSGTWFNASFGAVNNTLTAQYRYKVKDGSWSNWTSMSVSVYENTYEATADLSGLNYQNTYIFETRVTDKLTTVSSSESPVVSLPLFHWSKEDFIFEVPVTFKKGTTGGGEGEVIEDDVNVKGDLTVEGGATIKGDLRLKGAGNYGNSIFFGDGSYVSFAENTDDDLTIKATEINFDTNNLMLRSKKIDFGGWTPKLDNSSAVSSYSSQWGWWQQIGNVVTVGWQLKANINSGYQGSLIKITGLPFAPSQSASGGGMCSGAYVSANFNFQCWVVGTDGNITARVQSCHNTMAGNLNTSASGLFYRTGGGEMTLSGTITFLIN